MKSILTFLIFVLFIGSGYSQKETRQLDTYSKLEVSGSIKLELYAGSPKAEIEVKKGDIEDLTVDVKNGTLHIKFKKKSWFWGSKDGKAFIRLYGADKLSALSVAAGASVESELTLHSDDFYLSISSGADADLDLESSNVSADASSGASLSLTGNGESLKTSASSGARIDADDFECSKVNASVSSGALIKVWAKDELSASASSGGTVRYKGEPSNKNLNSGKYSGGSISAL